MATIPNTYGRRPTPRFGGVDQADKIVTPSSADIIQGQSLQDFGSTVSGYFLEAQKRQNVLEANAATVEYKQKLSELKREMESKRGSEVAKDKNFFSGFTARHEDLTAELLRGIDSPTVARNVRQQMDLGKINLQESMTTHITRERDKYETQVFDVSLKQGAGTMGANAYNESLQGQARIDIREAVEDYADSHKLAPEVRDKILEDALTNGHMQIITRMVDDGNYEEAEEHFNDFNKDSDGQKLEIAEEQHSAIRELLETAGTEGRTQDLSDDTYARFSDDKKGGLAHIRENARPEDRAEALRLLKNLYAEADGQEKDAWAAAGTSVRGQYSSVFADPNNQLTPTQIWRSIPLSAKLDMKPSELMAMEAKVASDAAGTPIKTDISTYFAVEDFIRNYPEEAKTMDLSKYETAISTTDLKALNTLRHKDPKVLGTETSIMKEGVIALGIDPKELLDENSGDGKKARALQTWVRNNLSPDYDKQELQDTVNRGVIKVITDEGWLYDTEEYAYTAGDRFNITGVHPNDVDEGAAAVQATGLPVTAGNVQIAVALMQAGEEVTVDNIKALQGSDIESVPLPEYDRQSLDFPGRTDTLDIKGGMTIRGNAGG